MNPTILSEQQHHILYDSDVVSQIVPQWFDIEYWQNRAQTQSTTAGRGQAWFIETGTQSMVLRHYQRGGWMAGLLDDKYLWLGLEQSRAWREWHLLAWMWQREMPVPKPLAAHVVQRGLFYHANLLTQKIPDTQSLSRYLQESELSQDGWQKIGRTIRQFHHSLVYHADLNAHNILINTDLEVYLIDFDKGMRKSAEGKWQHANLLRLKRSLDKLHTEDAALHYSPEDWGQLLSGYSSL